jgi:hypothetical protein
MKEVVPMDFQCMLKVEKSIVWHGRWKWRSLECPNASIVVNVVLLCFDQSASDGYHFKGYLNGVNI